MAGSTTWDGADCYTLTPALNYQVGSLWGTNKVSLDRSFEIFADIYLGTRDATGADGMTFSLQPVNNTAGNSGEGMGMQGIAPSFFVEFDTWQNTNLSDPLYDHMAIFRDGVVTHGSANELATPVGILAANANAEDSTYHLIQITWDADSMIFRISVDCLPRLTYQGDIVATVFSGDPLVYWGFTAATGGSVNEQKFCFRYISFEETDSAKICLGDSVQLNTIPGIHYNWRPYDGLSDPSIQNPVATPDSTTKYFVKVIDLCGNPRWDTVFVEVNRPEFRLIDSISICQGDSALVNGNYVTDPGTFNTDTLQGNSTCDSLIDQIRVDVVPVPQPAGFDVAFCPPEPVFLSTGDSTGSFLWSTGETGPGIAVADSGTYWVDVESNGCTGRAYFRLTLTPECSSVPEPPNVFTPNGDEVNDLFFIKGLELVRDFRLNVYNRWGELVYSNSDRTHSWDGTFNGNPLAEGVYYFVLDYTNHESTSNRMKGTVTLFR